MNLVDLPYEILFIIFKKLDNMNVLYSLFNLGNQRLDRLVQDKTFTKTLNFVMTPSTKDICSIDDLVFHRFCVDILPRIGDNVRSLILETGSMERILRAGTFSNLTQFKLFNFSEKVLSLDFRVESPFRHIFQEQITDLTLVYRSDINTSAKQKKYPTDVLEHILQLFPNLKHFSITDIPLFCSLSVNICYSRTLSTLNVCVNRFEHCLALLDGRFKQLTTFIVRIDTRNYRISRKYKKDRLPNLKCFSLACWCVTKKYDTQVLSLLRRMSNLEELTLNITNKDRMTFVDGTQIHDGILVHLPRLNKFVFHITTDVRKEHIGHHLSDDDIQETFTKIGYREVGCIVRYMSGSGGTCQVFSLPFVGDNLYFVGNRFPSIVFHGVKGLSLSDDVPFEYECFLRIARFFPSLTELSVFSRAPQLHSSDVLDSNGDQLYPLVEYPHLISLRLYSCHKDYIEQFLNNKKTHLPRLTELEIFYNDLRFVTEDFTRDATRFNCGQVKQLIIHKTLVPSKDFCTYFPLL